MQSQSERERVPPNCRQSQRPALAMIVDTTADLEESEHEQDKLDFHSDNDDDDNNDDRYITVTYTPSKLLHSVKTRTTKLHQVASVTKVPDQNYEIHTLKNVVLC